MRTAATMSITLACHASDRSAAPARAISRGASVARRPRFFSSGCWAESVRAVVYSGDRIAMNESVYWRWFWNARVSSVPVRRRSVAPTLAL